MSKKKTYKKDDNGIPDNLKYISDIREKIEKQQQALKKIIENLKNDN